MTITVYMHIPSEDFMRRFIFDLSSDTCALVEAGLRSFYPNFPTEGYVQLIHAIGGGIPFTFVGCT